MLRVGLTGGIASGKSRVLRRLEAGGCSTLDLDRVAHDVMAPGGPAYDEVVEAFGGGVVGPDRAIDRKALAAVVFRDARARERLNAIVHPRVRAEERTRTSAAAAPDAIVVVDAALLVEAGLHLRFDRLVVVCCSPEQQLERLMARDALSREQAEARIRAQLPAAEKRRFAHFEVDSSRSPEDTDAAADALLESLRALARVPVRPLLPSPATLAPWFGPAAVRVLDEITRVGGLEMPGVARALGRGEGPWLAGAEPSGIVASEVVPAGVAWSLARRGEDDELLGLAAFSLARAVTSEPLPIAEACASAWRMARLAAGRADVDLAAARAFALRWSGRETEAPPALERKADAATLAAVERFLLAARGFSSA